MTQIAHIRSGRLVRTYSQQDDGSYKGWVDLESGDKASPPQLGYISGNDKIVPMVEETQNTSTGTVRTVRTDTGWQVEADRVYRLITIRDMTEQELLDRKEQQAVREADLVLGEIQRRAMNLLFSLAKANTPSLTLQQFVSAFEGPLGNEPITRQMFIDYIRDNRL